MQYSAHANPCQLDDTQELDHAVLSQQIGASWLSNSVLLAASLLIILLSARCPSVNLVVHIL